MKNRILLIVLSLVFLASCTQNHHSGPHSNVELDGGNKWQANPETTAGIASMQAILAKHHEQEMDFTTRQNIREQLENEFQEIFKQCTMKGEAHNQLHNYLLPMVDLFKKIDQDDSKVATQAIEELNQHLDTYQNYFE